MLPQIRSGRIGDIFLKSNGYHLIDLFYTSDWELLRPVRNEEWMQKPELMLDIQKEERSQ